MYLVRKSDKLRRVSHSISSWPGSIVDERKSGDAWLKANNGSSHIPLKSLETTVHTPLWAADHSGSAIGMTAPISKPLARCAAGSSASIWLGFDWTNSGCPHNRGLSRTDSARSATDFDERLDGVHVRWMHMAHASIAPYDEKNISRVSLFPSAKTVDKISAGLSISTSATPAVVATANLWEALAPGSMLTHSLAFATSLMEQASPGREYSSCEKDSLKPEVVEKPPVAAPTEGIVVSFVMTDIVVFVSFWDASAKIKVSDTEQAANTSIFLFPEFEYALVGRCGTALLAISALSRSGRAGLPPLVDLAVVLLVLQ